MLVVRRAKNLLSALPYVLVIMYMGGGCARVKSMRANNLMGTTNFVKKIFAACSLKSVTTV